MRAVLHRTRRMAARGLDAKQSETIQQEGLIEEERQFYLSLRRVLLEVLNTAIIKNLSNNPELVYALLHQQEVFETSEVRKIKCHLPNLLSKKHSSQLGIFFWIENTIPISACIGLFSLVSFMLPKYTQCVTCIQMGGEYEFKFCFLIAQNYLNSACHLCLFDRRTRSSLQFSDWELLQMVWSVTVSANYCISSLTSCTQDDDRQSFCFFKILLEM